MNQSISLYAAMAALSVTLMSCSDATSPAVRPVAANRSVAATAALAGRIVYTQSGNLRIYDVATKADVGLGVSGVNPKFSPNGALIVYQGGGGIRVMNSDGSNNRLLNDGGGVPSFDPTSTMVAFNDSGIWRINVDGTGLVRLAVVGRKPTWSPDGTQISYHAPVGTVEQLFLMNADGTNQRQVLVSAAVIDPVWLQSSKIVLAVQADRNWEIHTFDPAVPSSLARLTTRKGNDFEPSWSPDGTGISWASLSQPSGIWIMNADGSGQQGPVIAKGRQGSWGP